MSTQENFETIVASAIDGVLYTVSTYLENERKIQVSVEDLRSALEMPAQVTPLVAATPTRGRRTAAASTGATKARGKSTVERCHKDQKQSEGLCHYVITRGDFKDYYCSNNATVGRYCSGCSKKKGPREEISKNLNGSSPSSAPGVAPGHRSSAMPPKDEVPEDDDDTIEAQDIPGYADLLFLPSLGLIVQESDYTVVARMVNEVPRKLDAKAIELAKEAGLDYDENAFNSDDGDEPVKEESPVRTRPARTRGRMPPPSD